VAEWDTPPGQLTPHGRQAIGLMGVYCWNPPVRSRRCCFRAVRWKCTPRRKVSRTLRDEAATELAALARENPGSALVQALARGGRAR